MERLNVGDTDDMAERRALLVEFGLDVTGGGVEGHEYVGLGWMVGFGMKVVGR